MKPLPPGDAPGQAGWTNSAKYLKQEGSHRYCDGCGEVPHEKEEFDSSTGEPILSNIPLKRCTKCHHAWYHNRACQVRHHPDHKATCHRWSKTIKDDPRLESYPFVVDLQEETAEDHRDNMYAKLTRIWDIPGESALDWHTTKRPEFANRLMFQDFILPMCFQNDETAQVDVIMDFGCATGSLCNIMRPHAKEKVIAFDISKDMIRWVRDQNWHGVEAVAGCLTSAVDPTITSFRQKYHHKVDLIVCNMMLPYIPQGQVKATMMAFHDLLKPKTGKLFHIDASREDPLAYFPVYATEEEWDTYHKWGELKTESLKTKTHSHVLGAKSFCFTSVIGLAKKEE